MWDCRGDLSRCLAGFRGRMAVPSSPRSAYIYIYIRVILGLYWDNGKENGNYYDMIG